MSVLGPLDTVTRRAGAVVVSRDGVDVAAHYGSPAGELAVCVRAVGLADRSDLGKLALTGAAAPLADLVRRVTGDPLAAAGVSSVAGAWWCGASAERVLVLCERERRGRMLEVLRGQAGRSPGVELRDESAAWAAIALVGRRAGLVLAALGALGPDGGVRAARPFASVHVGGVPVDVLLQSDRRALLLVEPAGADRVWRACEAAGRPLGMSCVGSEAVGRFAMLDRPALSLPAVAAAA